MMSLKFTLASASLFLALAPPLADATKFRVVGFPGDGKSIAVKVNGALTPLTLGTDQTVWTGDVSASEGTKYSYAITDSSNAQVQIENFERTLDAASVAATANDIWMRKKTVADIPDLPQAYDRWPQGYSGIFNPSYIPTLHVIADPTATSQIDTMFSTLDGKSSVTLVFVGQSDVLTRTNVEFGLSGKSNKAFRKQQLAFHLPAGNHLAGRQVLKLRTGSVDPSFLRERTYTDVANSIGVPTQQGTHVRLYINKKFFGFYFMVDDMGANWAEQVITGAPPANTLVQLDSGGTVEVGDFNYKGDTSADYEGHGYKMKAPGPNPSTDPLADMVVLIKKLNDFNPSTATAEQIAALESVVNFDLLFRHAALEFLAIHWDGSWHAASNFFFTNANGKWFISPTDFDTTHGTLINEVPGGINSTYSNWYVGSTDAGYKGRPLFEKPLAVPALKAKFEVILREVVQKVWHKNSLKPRLDALHEFLRDDVADDRNPAIFTPPTSDSLLDYHWTIEHFDISYQSGASGANLACDGWDCSWGILDFVSNRADNVAKQLAFTYEDTYTAPDKSKLYGYGAPKDLNVDPAANTAKDTDSNSKSSAPATVPTTWTLALLSAMAAVVHRVF